MILGAWDAASDNVGVASYTVATGATLTGTTARLSFTVSSLSPTTSYTFSVTARDAAGNVSPASNTVTVTTQAADGLPPDPGAVAPATDQTVATDMARSADWRSVAECS